MHSSSVRQELHAWVATVRTLLERDYMLKDRLVASDAAGARSLSGDKDCRGEMLKECQHAT
ncbi:hypothetical protein EYF80_052495 [Liparis tanakae]|uniref:PH domain-containing protein n=1 Tax=Liparis tanakae TaxID=230148 RepID=A0A4Z2FAF4_9TELE|nr:hypothetical protein EYF80_052495 [Liparis tanakae]